MREERNSLRQAAITAGILAAMGVCTLRGDLQPLWAAEPSNNAAQAEVKTEAAQDVSSLLKLLLAMAWILTWRV